MCFYSYYGSVIRVKLLTLAVHMNVAGHAKCGLEPIQSKMATNAVLLESRFSGR
jgi:hypothetical protein